jgi:hypothetical protein
MAAKGDDMWRLTALLGIVAPWVTHAQSLPEPIAEASRGQLECYSPDVARKTCHSLAAYSIRSDGMIDSASTVLLSRSPAVTMSAVSQVKVKAGQVCGFVTPEELNQATFTVDGAAATPDQTTALRGRIPTAFQSVFGHEVCTGYVTDGGKRLATSSFDGVARPGADQPVAWVSPADGYSVQP